MKSGKSLLLLLLKTLVSVGLLGFLLSRIDLSGLLHALVSADPFYLAVVLVAYLLSQLISCLRWLLLARPLGFNFPFRELLSFYFIGMFFNLFAPSTVGGDIGRVFYLARGGGESHKPGGTAYALVSVLADRAIGLAVLVWIGAVALVLFPSYALSPLIYTATYAVALAFLLGWLSVPLMKRLLQYVGHPLIADVRLGLDVYWGRPSVILQAIALSVVAHLIQAALQIALGRALEIDVPWSYALILYPLVGLFSALPISLNGIGLREGGYLFLLRQLGIGAEKAIAFGFLWFLVVALDSLIGGVVFILRRNGNLSRVAGDSRLDEVGDQQSREP